MDKRERNLLKKLLELNAFLISNLSKENVNEAFSACERFEGDLRKIAGRSKPEEVPTPIWKKFSAMTEEEIRQEFSDDKKYPDLQSIKSAVKGFIELKKVAKVKTRETLIKHIVDTYRRGEFISKIGKEANEPEVRA